MTTRVAIIGAGMAGLAAGCYAQINGYDSQIFEMHNLPGGLCTAWKRRGYTFDGCIDWLVGTKPGTAMHSVWRRIGALGDQPIHHHEEFIRVTDPDGRTAIQYTDLDRLEEHLLELSPVDGPVIRELIGAARALQTLEMPVGKPRELFRVRDHLGQMWEMRAFLKVFSRFSRISVGEFAARFKDPLLGEMLTAVLDSRYQMTSLLATMGSLAARDAGWPRGGSLPFARGAEKRYLELGGSIHYHSRVTDVLLEDDRAVGIRLEGGEVVSADRVISCADGHSTLYGMLGGNHVPDEVAKFYSDKYPTITSVMVCMGVDHDFPSAPRSIQFPLDPPLEIAGKVYDRIGFTNYRHDPTLCAPGKSVIRSVFYADYDRWRGLAGDRKEYEAEKQRLAARVVEELGKRFPDAAGKVEVTDVATPITYTRYTGVWKGAYMSWISTPGSGHIQIPHRLSGLKNFYMGGLWNLGSAGLPGSAVSGRNAVQVMCVEDGNKFRE